MTPFASRMTSGNAWVIPVSVLSLVLGFMVMAASITASTRSTRLGLLGSYQKDRVGTGTLDLQQEYMTIQEEVTKLRRENNRLQEALGKNDSSSKVLNESLQEAKAFAGLTDVQGPGLKVTLHDSKKSAPAGYADDVVIVHDTDVLKIVNELFAAGAEAIDVNGHRVVSTSSFRCVGPVIHCDGVPISSPVAIRAIGDPATLKGGIDLPLGVLSEIRSTDPDMVSIEEVKSMRIGAYNGSTARKFAKVPEEKK